MGLPSSLAMSSDASGDLQGLDVRGLPAFRSFDDVELHRLAFLQAFKAGCVDCRVMHEHILAILTAYKPESLSVVKPLHRALFHNTWSLFCTSLPFECKDATAAGADGVPLCLNRLRID
jgi:hypothetical protein